MGKRKKKKKNKFTKNSILLSFIKNIAAYITNLLIDVTSHTSVNDFATSYFFMICREERRIYSKIVN
jgi:hypothetical protein